MIRANAEAARRFGLTLDQLQEVTRDLEVRGQHNDGSDVFRWRDLLAALGQLPDPGETASHRGARATVNRKQKAVESR